LQFFDAVWIKFPLFVAIVLIAFLWLNPSTRGFAKTSLIVLAGLATFVVLLAVSGEGAILSVLVLVFGPWVFLLYLILGGMIAAATYNEPGNTSAT
jgi:hypothetical protein